MPSVHTVSLEHSGRGYEIRYHHGRRSTPVDRSDRESGHDKAIWFQAARQHARAMGATFKDNT